MPAADSVREISALFEQEITLSVELLSLMKAEQAALAANDIPALELSITGKDKLVRDMAAVEAILKGKLDSIGIDMSPAGLDTLLSRCGTHDRQILSDLFKRLQTISAECRNQNLVNSKIIEASANNLSRFFNILQGQTQDQADLYNPKGKSTRNAGSRIVERA